MGMYSSGACNRAFGLMNVEQRLWLRRAYRAFRQYGDVYWSRQLTLGLVIGSRIYPS